MTPVPRVVFSCWTGRNRMSAQRRRAFESLRRHVGVSHVHVTAAAVRRWIDPALPLHPMFGCLSAVHQSDYLRCYLLHVHGGGYSDVKPTARAWAPFFDAVDASRCVGAGYTEIGPHGVAPIDGTLGDTMRARYRELIGCCAMIFRPRSPFTARWYAGMMGVMDRHAAALRRHPARYPFDRRGVRDAAGTPSRYPLRWTELLGDVFHPLVWAYRRRLLHLDMAPSFEDYK